MSRKVFFVLLMVLAAQVIPAQSLENYLAIRKRYKITQAAEVAALETLVGTRILEVEGKVKGSVCIGDCHSIFLEDSGGGTLIVESGHVPDWLSGNEVLARLVVRASRAAEYSQLKCELLGVAPAFEIQKIDDAVRQKAEAAARKQGTQKPKNVKGKDWYLPESQVTPIYANFIQSKNKRLSDEEAMLIAKGIIGFSLKYGVDARLIMAMVMVESGFNPNATSHAGAMGLGQLMPGTAEWMGVEDAYNSVDNLYGTVKLVRTHLDQYKAQTGGYNYDTLVLTLAAYNAGSGAVKKHGGVPPYKETQNYVRKVISLYKGFSGQR